MIEQQLDAPPRRCCSKPRRRCGAVAVLACIVLVVNVEEFVGVVRSIKTVGDVGGATDDKVLVGNSRQQFDLVDERSLYPWGMRSCSGTDRGKVVHFHSLAASASSSSNDVNLTSVEMFDVPNSCDVGPNAAEILFAHIGPMTPDDEGGGRHHDVLDTIRITRRSNPCARIRFLVSKSAFFHDDDRDVRRVCECYGVRVVFTDNFESTDGLLNQFRNAFSVSENNMCGAVGGRNFDLLTTSRIFYVRAYMEAFGVDRAFHLENDNPAYVDLVRLGGAYTQCKISLGVSRRDQKSYTLGGFTFLTRSALGRLARHYVESFQSGRENFTERLGTPWINDVTLTSDYASSHPEAVTVLPSDISSDLSSQGTKCAALQTELYIDGASVGTWFHVTQNEGTPFENNSTRGRAYGEGSFDPRPYYDFGWIDPPDHRCAGPALLRKKRNSKQSRNNSTKEDATVAQTPPPEQQQLLLRFANLDLHKKGAIDRATPACSRAEESTARFPFSALGNWSAVLRDDAARDLDVANGEAPLGAEEKDRKMAEKAVQSAKSGDVSVGVSSSGAIGIKIAGPSNAGTQKSSVSKDRRSSYPFITGDGFRSLCRNICDPGGCNFDAGDLRRGDCIFLDSGSCNSSLSKLMALLDGFKERDRPIPKPFVIVTHNSDCSYPKRTRKPHVVEVQYDNTDFMESALVHHWFASNCDWRGSEHGVPRPDKLTCLPIGIENRYNPIGKHPERYLDAMERIPLSNRNGDNVGRRMLYVSFLRSPYKPQRAKVLSYLESLERRSGRPLTWITRPDEGSSATSWYNFTVQVRSHRFVLCPLGNGLDTHRLWEVLLLGSVPVVKSSTLDSNYEGLPVLILRDWSELTESRLVEEWGRLSHSTFELDRLFFPYWENRIRRKLDEARSYFGPAT